MGLGQKNVSMLQYKNVDGDVDISHPLFRFLRDGRFTADGHKIQENDANSRVPVVKCNGNNSNLTKKTLRDIRRSVLHLSHDVRSE